MSALCPSHAWDRHVAELDAAAEAEQEFYRTHRADILAVACALIAGGYFEHAADIRPEDPADRAGLIEDAAKIVESLQVKVEGEL